MATVSEPITPFLHLPSGTFKVSTVDWQRRAWVLALLSFGLTSIVMLCMPWITIDFNEYHRAALRVSRGETPYQLDDLGYWHCYRYPPAFAYLMFPLAHLDVAWAGRIWFIFNWLMLAGCLLLALHLVLGRRPWPAGAGAIALIAVYACSFYNASNMFQGQVSQALTLACLAWALCQRTGWHFLGGLCLAAGCALKLAPIVLIPYLLVRKDWRSLAGLFFGGAICFLVPVPWIGVSGAAQVHQDWLIFLKDTQTEIHNYRPGNQGLMGVLARLPNFSNGEVCYSTANLAVLQKYYPFIIAGLGALLYGWIFRDHRHRSRILSTDQLGQRENLYLALLFIFMTLANPCAWRCNFTCLILPCLILAKHYYQRVPGFPLSRFVLILVFLGWLWWPILLISSDGWSLGMWLLQGVHFWTAILVAGVCSWVSGQQLPGNNASIRTPLIFSSAIKAALRSVKVWV